MVLLLLPSQASAAEDFQYWSQGYGKITEEGKRLTFGVYGEMRLDENVNEVRGVFVGPKLGYKVNPYFNVGGAGKYILLRNSDGRYEQWQRLELEANPQVTKLLGGHLNLRLRNRFEAIRHPWDSDPATTAKSHTLRARHRFTVEWAFDKAGPLEKIYASNEWFWGQRFRKGALDYTEDRVVPFGLQLEASSFAKINVYYLIRITNSSDNSWKLAHCLGTFISFQPPRVAQ